MTALVAILTVAVILLAILVVGLLRSHAEILRTLHGLGVDLDPDARDGQLANAHGRPQPVGPSTTHGLGHASDISGVTPSLEPIAVSVTGPGRLTLLAFLSSSCLTCRTFWEEFAADDLVVPGNARLAIVAKGPDAESPADLARRAPTGLATLLSNEAWLAYHVPGAPYFVLVDGSGPTVIGEGTAGTWAHVSNMMTSALADAAIEESSHQFGHRHSSESPGENRERIDADLRAAGIRPGHPSLYARSTGDDGVEAEP